jgi:hypothetical protein
MSDRILHRSKIPHAQWHAEHEGSNLVMLRYNGTGQFRLFTPYLVDWYNGHEARIPKSVADELVREHPEKFEEVCR